LSSTGDKSVVKVHHAEGLDCEWPWENRDGVHLRREWNRPILGNVMAKKIDGCVYNQAVLAEPLEKILEVGKVLRYGGAGNQDIVQKHEKERQVSQYRP